MITGDILKQIAPNMPLDRVNKYVPLLESIPAMYDINNPQRFNSWLGNVLEESGEFTAMVENLNYSTQALLSTFKNRITPQQADLYGRNAKHPANQEMIANIIYGGSWGFKNLGNKQQGDGWMFRGRSLMQITGRYLYTLGANFHNTKFGTSFTPEQFAEALGSNIEMGVHSASWVWADVFNLNPVADKLTDTANEMDTFKQIVKKINGGYLNLDKRLMYYNRAKALIK